MVTKRMDIVTSVTREKPGTETNAFHSVETISSGTETHVSATPMPSESNLHASCVAPTPPQTKPKGNAFATRATSGTVGNQPVSVTPVPSTLNHPAPKPESNASASWASTKSTTPANKSPTALPTPSSTSSKNDAFVQSKASSWATASVSAATKTSNSTTSPKSASANLTSSSSDQTVSHVLHFPP